ncbi:Cys-tRNA(Pro) deacylase [Calidifontibacter sp. DB0510]|uniref:Cys-tRNA(Pro)/Cys-tRNA(Cys) deacylase n=1 Tax=Metallococcus carri TaxID=1656884 RepID=A0A967AXG3_9MICO|nr:Cys-tRNA(Pro) deacylase [Metallococcus carri]NHN54794.1 Cys-tRNA(Pro) deacylase [Metallococcus carri]NOP37139.1 Cys-tRNA(Pro) deacylase [Calidifontibacter sp. DB2511S]
MAKRAGADTAGTPATRVLREAGVAFEVRTYEHNESAPSYGLEAAEALGEPTEIVFKTLVAQTDRSQDKGLVVAVVPVHRQLDLKALAHAVGAKRATLAEPQLVERTTGYVLGGVSPIGQKRPLLTIVDGSAMSHERVLVSGGRRGTDLELSPADLLRVTGASTAPIAR